MRLTQQLVRSLGFLFATDVWLAEPTPFVQVRLIRTEFTPSPDLLLADLDFCDFTGSAAKHAGSASTQTTIDPATGDQIVQVVEPLGGWHWACSGAGPLGLPQTVYGYALLSADGTELIATERLAEAVTIAASDQSVDIGQVRFRLNRNLVS